MSPSPLSRPRAALATGLVALLLGVGSAGPALAAPQITNVLPSLAPTAGGTRLTIIGAGFGSSPGDVIFCSGQVVVPVADWAPTEIRVDLPQGNPGPCDIQVRGPAGSSNHWSGFSYDLPRLSSLSPSAGPAQGALILTIRGENFGTLATPTVTMGPKTMIGQRISHEEIRAILPNLPPGQTAWTQVEVAGGYDSNTLPYQVEGPVIEDFDPIFGPTTGGGIMSIGGRNFGVNGEDPLPVVRLGNIVATNVTRYEDGFLSCVAPPGAGNQRHLTVEVGPAISAPSTQAFFFMPPEITSFEPPEAPFTGSVPITIHGTNFGPPGTSVLLYVPTFGGTQFIPCDEVDQVRAVAHFPLAVPGEFGLFVDVEGQWSKTRPFTFRFFPEILSYGPYEGPTQGGTPLTILGREFGIAPGTVHLGPWTCPIDSWQNESILCQTPPGYGGEIMPLSVENGAGSSETFYFTYESPQLLEVDPMFMNPAGGQVITLRGENFGIAEAPLFVEFAGQPASIAQWVSHHEVRVTSPPGAPNQVGLVCVRMGPAGEESCEDFQYGNPVGIEPRPLPVAFGLRMAGPNPSRGATAFAVDLPRDASYRLLVFDSAGRLVRRFEETTGAGSRVVTWDGADARGARAPAGLYWARLEVAGATFVQKAMRL